MGYPDVGYPDDDEAAGGGVSPLVVMLAVLLLLTVAVAVAVVALRKVAPLGVLPSWLVEGPCGRILPANAPSRSQAASAKRLAKEEEGEELLWQQLARRPATRVAVELEEEDDLD